MKDFAKAILRAAAISATAVAIRVALEKVIEKVKKGSTKSSLLLLLAATVFIGGCSTLETASDEQALVYEGVTNGADKFDHCIGSMTFENHGFDWNDTMTVLPSGQRTWRFNDGGKDADAPALTVATKDVTMKVPGTATFEFTKDCDTLRWFYENVIRKYQQQYGGDLNQWLPPLMTTYIHTPLDKAVDVGAKSYGAEELYSDPEKRTAWEKTAVEQAPQLVAAQATKPVFVNFTLLLQQPIPPDSILQAREQEIAAKAQNNAQKERNRAVQTELDSVKALVAVLGPNGYIAYQAMKDARDKNMPPPVQFVPQGSIVQVPATAR